ncbi:MAG: hypothetical protein Ct9H300mP1_20070 [Planctomycetaceae bacterium]|nr:MAG: hypothetical protein Ct9H300mP1_20070 [Planctomycetaceae bacterium]
MESGVLCHHLLAAGPFCRIVAWGVLADRWARVRSVARGKVQILGMMVGCRRCAYWAWPNPCVLAGTMVVTGLAYGSIANCGRRLRRG